MLDRARPHPKGLDLRSNGILNDQHYQYLCFSFRVGHNEIIGVCRVGINAEGLGRDHWNEMLAYPRKPIAHWHSLVEVKKSFKEVGEVARPLACFLHDGVGWRMAVGCCESPAFNRKGA